MTVGNRNDATHRHPSSRDATLSAGGIEFGRVPGLILECLESPGRRPGRPRLGYLRRQAEVSHDSLHNRRLFNERHEAQPPAAARTRQDIESKRALHQLGPLIRTGPGRPAAARVLVTLHRRLRVRRLDTV